MFDTWIKLNPHYFLHLAVEIVRKTDRHYHKYRWSWSKFTVQDRRTTVFAMSLLVNAQAFFSFWSMCVCRHKLYRWYIGSSESLIYRYRDQRRRPYSRGPCLCSRLTVDIGCSSLNVKLLKLLLRFFCILVAKYRRIIM